MAKGKKLSQLELKSKQIIASAKKDFGTTINGYPIKWKITSDDGGRLLEAVCEDWDACGELREKISSNYMVFRTIGIGYARTEDKSALRDFSYVDPDDY